MSIPIQRCKYCGVMDAKADGSIPLACPNCYRWYWAIDTTKQQLSPVRKHTTEE